jgi:hypothetical protein
VGTPEAPDFAKLLGPFVAAIPERSRPGFLCLLERAAANRYREWAEQCPPEQREGLLACAAREDEIANRVEKILPADASDRGALEAQLPEAGSKYMAIFTNLSLTDQFRLQASAERQGAAAWRGIASQLDASLRDELEGCAQLEEASASYLESLLGGR